ARERDHRRRRGGRSWCFVWTCGRLLESGLWSGDGTTVVLGEVTRLGATLAEPLFEPSCRVLGDVLVQSPRGAARLEDPLDGVVVEGTEAGGMAERGVEIGGGVAGTQNEDAPRLVAPDARGPGGEQPEERGGPLAHALEGGGELVEIDGTRAARRGMVTGGIELRARASWRELVAGDAPKVGGIDEELALGDADGQDVGHVLVRDRVPVALPIDEAVDAANAVRDASGVVGVAWERDELALLFRETVEAGKPASLPQIDDAVEPLTELDAQVVHVSERAAVEERALELPEAPLDPRLCIGVAAHGAGPELVVRREREEARVVDGLGALPAQGD